MSQTAAKIIPPTVTRSDFGPMGPSVLRVTHWDLLITRLAVRVRCLYVNLLVEEVSGIRGPAERKSKTNIYSNSRWAPVRICWTRLVFGEPGPTERGIVKGIPASLSREFNKLGFPTPYSFVPDQTGEKYNIAVLYWNDNIELKWLLCHFNGLTLSMLSMSIVFPLAHYKLELAPLFWIFDKGRCLRSGHLDYIPLPSQLVRLLNWELMQWNYWEAPQMPAETLCSGISSALRHKKITMMSS